MDIKIPESLHEVLGERQRSAELWTIGLVTVILVLLWFPELAARLELEWWRRVLGGLLLLDIAAGAAANVTAGTNAFYASRPRHRWVFIALHIHLPVLAAALGEPLVPALLVWGYTIGAASVLNLLSAHPSQRAFAAGLLCIGLMALPLLPLGPLGLVASALFLFKVVYSFAVNHGGETPHG